MDFNLIKRIFMVLVLSFIIIFTARTVYVYNTPVVASAPRFTGYSNFLGDSIAFDRQTVNNFASQKVEHTTAGVDAVLDQKYERIANITSTTANFNDDFARFHEILEENGAVVQMQDSRGLPGNRRVDLVVGVRPDNFDQMHEAVLEIGDLISSSSTIVDKTLEYRQMIAEKELLERRKERYEELKTHGGTIPELLQLTDRIIQVDIMIQEQLVSLGEYSDDNALCTINFSLYEDISSSEVSRPRISNILWNALTWSIGVYIASLGVILFVSFVAFALAYFWNYLKKTMAQRQVLDRQKSKDNDDD